MLISTGAWSIYWKYAISHPPNASDPAYTGGTERLSAPQSRRFQLQNLIVKLYFVNKTQYTRDYTVKHTIL